MLLFKNNKEVALTLACIISTVKTMMLACKEDDPFFVQNEIYQKQGQICYLARVNVYMISFSVTCMNPHVFAKKIFSFQIPCS